jgi:1-acyl-sn-glycerol-3-phosphate acyltransferase
VASLWLSQLARVAADNALRFFIVLLLFSGDYPTTAWYIVTGILMAPALLLAPLNGAITNAVPKPTVLRLSAMLAFVVSIFAVTLDRHSGASWLVIWALIACAAALYGPTRYALLPAAADDAHWPLTRLNGVFETGAAAAIIGGMLLPLGYYDVNWEGFALVPLLAALLGALAIQFALPVRFASDVYRQESPSAAIRSFFADARAIASERELRVCLGGLALLRAVVTGVTGALLPRILPDAELNRDRLLALVPVLGWVTAGWGIGSLLAGLQPHPRRVLGMVSWGALGLGIGLLFVAGTDMPSSWLLVLLGIAPGVINVPLAATYQADLPADARGNGMTVRNFTDYVAVTVASLILALLAGPAGLSPTALLVLLGVVSLIAALYAAWFFRRETAELLLEAIILPMYRFEAFGPGLDAFPRRGPVLVIANHSAWLDPIWLGKVLPRRLIPMMTRRFFDVPVLRWMMIYLAQAIRVDTGRFRRDVPELHDAIAALDRGECLLIFPEGVMRRQEETPLRLFGQGVWHILHERPDTPIVICWIEGGWGSYFSYKDGLPTKNKPFDRRRLIRIAIGKPHTVSPEQADQRATRLALMQECLELRRYLGLQPHEVAMLEDAESE